MFVKDPLASLAVFRDNATVIRAAEVLGLPYLPMHLHEILGFGLFYTLIYFFTGPLLRNWAPYRRLSAAHKSGFATHVVSEVNALLILALSYPMFNDPYLPTLTSYTPYAGFVAAMFTGYFLFDMAVCSLWYKFNGIGFVAHAFASFFVFIQGNRPFMHNYSASYLWFEASTPFVNTHWLATNVPNVVSPTFQTVNGVLLIIVFLLCRVIPGPINGYYLFKVALLESLPGVPYWVVLVVFMCYTTLTLLNFYWFGKMIAVAYQVLTKPKPVQVEEKPVGEPIGKTATVPAPAAVAQPQPAQQFVAPAAKSSEKRVRKRKI